MPLDVAVRDAKAAEIKAAALAASRLGLPHPPHDPDSVFSRALAELHARIADLEARIADLEKR